MTLHQAGGRTDTRAELAAIAQGAGFDGGVLFKLHAPGFGVVVFRKP